MWYVMCVCVHMLGGRGWDYSFLNVGKTAKVAQCEFQILVQKQKIGPSSV